MLKILSFFAENWVRFLVSILIGLGLMAAYNGISNTWTLIIGYCNGSFIAAFTLISISILIVLNLFGAFDIFSFYFRRKTNEEGKKEALYEYAARKKEERWKYKMVFLPYLVVGGLFLIASLILYFLI